VGPVKALAEIQSPNAEGVLWVASGHIGGKIGVFWRMSAVGVPLGFTRFSLT